MLIFYASRFFDVSVDAAAILLLIFDADFHDASLRYAFFRYA